jgi:undecaprenyl diphosphate synthase
MNDLDCGPADTAACGPRHVAIVMDGNGRWARKRFMPRVYGHKVGVDTLVRAVQACADRGIEYLSVFAFSSENWKRPTEEVSGLMNLVLVAVSKYLYKLAGDGVRIRIVGDRGIVSDKLRAAWEDAERLTAHNTRITLSVAFNYGGRWDVVQACRRIVEAGVAPEQVDEALVGQYMAMSYAPDPDLFIRTGGEIRISNFMLWQTAYSEFYFTDCLWPDFDEGELDAALAAYARRDRRFGEVKDSAPALIAGAGL